MRVLEETQGHQSHQKAHQHERDVGGGLNVSSARIKVRVFITDVCVWVDVNAHVHDHVLNATAEDGVTCGFRVSIGNLQQRQRKYKIIKVEQS